MRVAGSVLVAVLVLLGATACGGGGSNGPSSSPSPSSTVPVDSVAAFSAFSGLPIPAQAREVAVRATLDSTGQPEYRVTFRLPSDALDQFCADGQLDRPLRVQTVPQSYRDTFGYTGDSSTGVAVTEGGLPSDQRVQRQLLAVGTATSTAEVQVYAHRIPS